MREWGLSLVGIRDADTLGRVLSFEPALRFELAYDMSRKQVEAMAPLVEGRVLSVHAACPKAAYFPNFASDDPEVLAESLDDIRSSIATAHRFHASLMVLHPGYLCEDRMPSDTASRMALLSQPRFQKHVAVSRGAIANRRYPVCDDYRRAMDRLCVHIADVARLCHEEGIQLAVENLNPRCGYLCMTPADFERLASIDHMGFCLDIGHLWISHFAFGFDFLGAMERMFGTGKVVSCHLHANLSDGKTIWEDSHQDLDVNPRFPLDEALGLVISKPVNCILETLERPEHNIKLFKTHIA